MKLNKLFALALILALGPTGWANSPTPSTAASLFSTAPLSSWSFDYGFSTKVFYDTNVYQSGLGPLGDQKSFGVAAGVSVKATDNFKNGSQLAFTYAPTGYLYTANYKLDCLSQAFSAEEKFNALDFNWDLKQSLTWVAGQDALALYVTDAGAAYSPGFAVPEETARTNQLLWGESFNVNRKWDKWLLEFVGNGLYQNFESAKNSLTVGYTNLTDRYDVNAGFDVGYEAWKNVYLLAGWRTGYQWQGINTVLPYQYTNEYNRYLVGVRGNITRNLKVDFLAGPDMKVFTGATYPGHGFDST